MTLEIIHAGMMMGEDTRKEYETLVTMVRQDYGVVGMVETVLADQIAQAAWEIRQIEAYEAHVSAEIIKAHESKISDWWRKAAGWNVSMENPQIYIEAREYEIEALELLSKLPAMQNSEPLDGHMAVTGLHDICDYQGVIEYQDDHPKYDGVECYIIPGEETYYEIDDCDEMYKNWTVGRAKKCLKYLEKEHELKARHLISQAKKNNEGLIRNVKSAIAGFDDERKRLDRTKITLMDEIEKKLEPYRNKKKWATDKVLRLSTQLATMRAKREGKLAANTPVVIEAAFDTLPNKNEEKADDKPSFEALLGSIGDLSASMPKLTDILNMPNGAAS